MNDRIAFLRRIIETPDDDVPRLVFADWLQEHDEDERAAFIRAQCELAKLPLDWRTLKRNAGETRESRMERVVNLNVREQELFAKGFASWFPAPEGRIVRRPIGNHDIELQWVNKTGVISVVVRRGFVESIACSAEDWLAHEAALTWCVGKCPWCKGDGIYYPPGRSIGGPAPPWDKCSCDGGRVPPTMNCNGSCGQCDRGFIYTGMDGMKWIPCPRKVTRPFPPTAQPIAQCVLTSLPQPDGVLITGGDTPADILADFAIRWPGIAFKFAANVIAETV